MENAYGIGVKNRYDLFYNEDVDPFEILKQQEVEKLRRKAEKGTTKEKPKISTSKPGKPAPAPGPVKKGKEAVSPTTSKPTENTELPIKPRNSKPYGDRIAKISTDEVRDNEEKKNFRNRDDQHSGLDNSNFTRNTAVKRGNLERDRGEGEFRRGRGGGGFRGRGGRGGGRGRGGGGGFSNFEGRKRDFDRHSGSDRTGIRHVDKREGAGTGNWGSVKDEFYPAQERRETTSEVWDEPKDDFERTDKKENPLDDTWGEVNQELEVEQSKQVIPETTETAGEETTAENTESKENVPVVDEEAIEEAAREMTLDEWKREQEAKRAVPKFNLRKPGEGEDGNQWKKLYQLKKKAKEDDDDEEDEEEEDDEEFGRRGRHRQLIDIQINFNDSRRGGRGRGGRGARGAGGPRTTGGNGGGPGPRDREDRNRGERGDASGPGERGPPGDRGSRISRGPSKMKTPQQSAPRVDDWNDFPSLVTA